MHGKKNYPQIKKNLSIKNSNSPSELKMKIMYFTQRIWSMSLKLTIVKLGVVPSTRAINFTFKENIYFAVNQA